MKKPVHVLVKGTDKIRISVPDDPRALVTWSADGTLTKMTPRQAREKADKLLANGWTLSP